MTSDELKARTKKIAIDVAKLCKILPNQIPTLLYVEIAFESEMKKLIKEGNEILAISVASINTARKKNQK